MKPFIVLLAVFGISVISSYFMAGHWNIAFSGRLALCMMLLFTASGHFLYTKGMAMMVPGFIPAKKFIVYSSGIAEAVLAVAIMIASVRYIASISLLIFLIIVFPANLNAAFNNINYQKADHTGPGAGYLWFRIPFQFFLLFWIWMFCL